VKIGVLKDTAPGERRVALSPDGVKMLAKDEIEVVVERGAGSAAGFADAAYEAAGATLGDVAQASAADLVLQVQLQAPALGAVRKGAAVAGLMRPLDDPGLARALAEQGVSAFSLELMPRITRAQSMDVLSSQATVAGYRAVLLAAVEMKKMFPMLVTAAGTISPARVFVIGAGVAGLQAIATAKRLGAVVEAYDTRAAAAEQVESLGAKFVRVELDAGDAEDAGGYAREQSEAFYQKQRELMAQVAARSDVVITTALVPGRPAPLLLTQAGVVAMKPGSVVIDLAAVDLGGVRVFGPTNLPSQLPLDASSMFSKNVVTFLRHLVTDGRFELDLEDEITSGTLVTHEGRVVNERVAEKLGGA
jgi:NAD(P) transhydrogenase subunit alpha